MSLLQVSKNYVFLKEKCVWCAGGWFVGVDTGDIYIGPEYVSGATYEAVISSVDQYNQTGMLHLNHSTMDFAEPENRRPWKEKYLGCVVTVREAHQNGETLVYHCLELGEYFSQHEIRIVKQLTSKLRAG